MTAAAKDPLHPVVSSALWAAWGDALGFITELTTSISEVSRRSGGAKVENTVPWSRRIGGRFGPMVALPPGTYSDDTQLRLAVSRSIRATGRFDLEAFSKIELPVFLSYELRAGRGTKSAAYALMKRHVRWSSNFFDSERATYVQAGGNGAAMRIQPHVWSAPGYVPKSFMGRVAADAITTHGHPRGVLGAVIHANALSSALRHGQIPGPQVWPQIVEYADSLPEIMEADEVLRDRWLPTWEKTAGRRWEEAVRETIREGNEMVAAARSLESSRDPARGYRELLVALGGKKRETVGSGMVAAIASLFAAWVFREEPTLGLRTIANELGSDTDTIGTMAGALLGATIRSLPPGPVLDAGYVASEAHRMVAIGEGQDAESFPHPDPLKWKPPRTLADAVGMTEDGQLAVAGLGPVVEANQDYSSEGKDESIYQWMKLAFGQTVLIKRRAEPKRLQSGSLPVERPSRIVSRRDEQPALFDDGSPAAAGDLVYASRPAMPDDVGKALDRVIAAHFDATVVGEELMRLVDRPSGSYERASDFAVAVTTAFRLMNRRPD